MKLKDIQKLIVDVTGLESEVMGDAVVQRAVNSRMDLSGVDELRGYGAVLHRSNKERQALINEVTVPETWFFRDKKPFDFLAEYATNQLRKKGGNTPLRILSLPCSSGEEAYSIVMSLLDAGCALDQFHVDAVDINTRVLARAKAGCYGRNSFRGEVGDYQTRYFCKNKDEYRINDALKTAVSFIHGNVLDAGSIDGLTSYDVIFCRNLLIYFNLENRAKVLKSLHSRLHHDGVFFLGHSETGRGVDCFFESIKKLGTFAYKKRKEMKPSSKDCFCNFPTQGKIKEIPPTKKTVLQFKTHASPKLREKQGLDSLTSSLFELESLANKGELSAAHALSLQLVKQYPVEASVYFWLGIICLGLGFEKDAFDALRKALYLNPTHYQALLYLATLSEQQGNNESAKNYRARLDRLKPGDVETRR